MDTGSAPGRSTAQSVVATTTVAAGMGAFPRMAVCPRSEQGLAFHRVIAAVAQRIAAQ